MNELLDQLKVSRSTLERAFRRELGWSPKEEFRRVRLKRVKDLLTQTDWSLERIAEEVGFLHTEYMMVQFKRMVGTTPSQWRDLQQPITSEPDTPRAAGASRR
jgi:LacI family transcriptional regulator